MLPQIERLHQLLAILFALQKQYHALVLSTIGETNIHIVLASAKASQEALQQEIETTMHNLTEIVIKEDKSLPNCEEEKEPPPPAPPLLSHGIFGRVTPPIPEDPIPEDTDIDVQPAEQEKSAPSFGK